MGHYPKGKLRGQGQADILTSINPSQLYTNNGNYLKIVVYTDWNNAGQSGNYLYDGNPHWFSFENFRTGRYFNIGSAMSLGQNFLVNTDEFSKPISVIVDNGICIVSQDGNTVSTGSGAITTTTLTIFPTTNTDANFYGIEFYDSSDNLIANLVPWNDSSNNPCIVEAVSDTVSYPTAASGYTLTYESLATFYPSQDTFVFDATGGSETFTVEAGNSWTATTPTYFTVSPLSGSDGTTTVTVTAGATAGGRNETVTFTDTELNTFDISITQTGDDAMVPFKKIIRGTRRIN